MSARDRRRERAKVNAPSNAGRTFKQYRVHLVIVLLFGAIVTGMSISASRGPECPGHWHSTQDFYVNGDRVSYLHGKYDLNGARANGGSMSVSAHMHNTGGNDYTWHFEPPTARKCIPYEDALRVIDTDLSKDRLVLDGEQDITGDFRVDSNHTLRAFHRVGDGAWDSISIGSLLDRQLRPEERLIVVYGNATDDIAAFQAAADSHAIESSSDVSAGSLVPAVGVGILGLVVLVGWHILSRKA